MNSVEKSANQLQLMVSFNSRILLFTLVAFSLLCGLGIWQLNRAAEKRELEELYAQRQASTPIELTSELVRELADFQRVFLRGFFDNEHTWLLDNKQRQGQVGYEVISPFVLEDGSRILVNRGWTAGKENRTDLPDIQPINGRVTLFAELASVSKHPLLDAENDSKVWPKVILALDFETMAQHLGSELLPRYLRLDESSPGALVTNWQPLNTTSSKHLGYAVQWFAMAFALIIWFICTSSNIFYVWRSRFRKS